MTLPNLVIAGAPKCGTTSLFAWLDAHPDVCGARVKETRFLVDPDDPLFKRDSNFRDHGLAGYHSYFDGCDASSASIVVEATPVYLYQRTALEVLSSLDPTPQVLFLLRKPSERVYSHFLFLRSKLVLDRELSLRDFVARSRMRDPSLPHRGHAREVIAQSRYITYLETWAGHFPPSHLQILLFEDLRRDERAFMRALSEKLGIDPAFYNTYDFPRENVTRDVRLIWLHRTRKRVARLLSLRARTILRSPTEGAYSWLNLRPVPARSSEESEVLAELDREFAPENERLAREMHVDLTPWS
jgi:hypothetical protein